MRLNQSSRLSSPAAEPPVETSLAHEKIAMMFGIWPPRS